MAEEIKLYSKYNYDDVFNRTVIVGLLNLMNNKISYTQTWENNVVETIYVPCMYDFGSSDERFAQDNYTFFGESCFGGKKIDGKFDMLPRCVIRYNGSSIDAANMTNKYLKGTFLKNENGKLTSYVAYFESIPITFTFNCEIWVDNMITAFKIEQSIRETFYKNKTFNILYKGMKLGCCAGFPEQHNIETTVSYSFDSERIIKMTFSVGVEAYQPSIDDTTEIDAAKRIESIQFDVVDMNCSKDIIQSIKFKNLTSGLYPSGSNMLIEWDSKSSVSDMCTVILEYIDEDNNTHLINNSTYNQHSFLWHIPDDFSTIVKPVITYANTDDIIDMPNIAVVPNLETKTIDKHSFVVLDPGLFKINNGIVSATVEYTNENNQIVLTGAYSFNISNRKIDINNPVNISGEPLVYTSDISPRKISIKITYPLNSNIYDKIDNILIL